MTAEMVTHSVLLSHNVYAHLEHALETFVAILPSLSLSLDVFENHSEHLHHTSKRVFSGSMSENTAITLVKSSWVSAFRGFRPIPLQHSLRFAEVEPPKICTNKIPILTQQTNRPTRIVSHNRDSNSQSRQPPRTIRMPGSRGGSDRCDTPICKHSD